MTRTGCGRLPLLAFLVVGSCAPSPGTSPPAAPNVAVAISAPPTAGSASLGHRGGTAPAPESSVVATSPVPASSGQPPAEPVQSLSLDMNTAKASTALGAEGGREQVLASLAATGARPADPFCEPRISPDLAEVLYRTAKNLIRAHGDHVSDGELKVILPLLRLAAHSGHRRAQAAYGQYIVGYYATDEMFWPMQPEVAADGLAMLRIVSADEPGIVDPEYAALYLKGLLLTEPEEPFPKAWLKRAQKVEEAWRRCGSLP